MTLKDKMKTYNFWLSLVSACLLIARIIGDKFGFSIDSVLVMDITTGVCGIFVILGIISAPQKNASTKGDIVVENTNQTTIAPNIVSYNEAFVKMQEKLQNNLQDIENETQNASIIKENNYTETVIEVEDAEIIDTVSTQMSEEEVILENSQNGSINDVNIDELSEELDEEGKIDEITIPSAILNSEESVIVEASSNVVENMNNDNNSSKLNEFLSSLSADDIEKLKTMI